MTVNGPIWSKQLGFCHSHEHLFIARGKLADINPSLCIDNFEKTVEELKLYKKSGGISVVDAQPVGCGRMANLANYLLEGDYEELGFILHSYTGHGGGHVYNYIKYQGKYYIVDFSSFLFNNYDVNSQFNIIALDKLEDYGTRWKECYGGLAEIIAHTSPGTHLPNVWEGDYCYYPECAKFTVLMQTPECMVGTLPCTAETLDWSKPQANSGDIATPSQPKVVISPDITKAVDLGLVPTSLNNEYSKNITRAEFVP
jgi:hypothetical protein